MPAPVPPPVPPPAPDRRAALARYERRADVYDAELALFEPIRRRAIARLELRPGALVLDVGCGTGLSLPLLRQAIGAEGRIVGIEQCAPMLDKARLRVAQHGCANVTLVCAPVEAADITGEADAALFHFTHDIVRSRAALANVRRHLKPGAKVVASGLRWARPWAAPTNLFVLAAALYSVSSLEGLKAPWSRLAELTGRLDIEILLAGAVYVASGRLAR